MDRTSRTESGALVRPCLTPDQIEAIARQLPGRQERDLMRLQQNAPDTERPNLIPR